jgi:hypothetical protein
LIHGAITESTGVYSIISIPGDTLIFSAVGYKKALMKIPYDSINNRFTIDVMLDDDTIRIDDVVIFPWKTYDEFKKAVINYEPNSIEVRNMNANIAMIRESLKNTDIKSSPEAGYVYAMRQNFYALSTKNQYPVNNLLNPFAWAKFFSGIKNGLFKNEPNTNKHKAKVKAKKNKGRKN